MAAGNWKEPDLLDFWPLENLSDVNLNWLDQVELAGGMEGNGNLANEDAGAQGGYGSPDAGGGSNKVDLWAEILQSGASDLTIAEPCLRLWSLCGTVQPKSS